VRSFHNFTKEFINPTCAPASTSKTCASSCLPAELSDSRGHVSVDVRYFVAFPNIRRQEFTDASSTKSWLRITSCCAMI